MIDYLNAPPSLVGKGGQPCSTGAGGVPGVGPFIIQNTGYIITHYYIEKISINVLYSSVYFQLQSVFHIIHSTSILTFNFQTHSIFSTYCSKFINYDFGLTKFNHAQIYKLWFIFLQFCITSLSIIMHKDKYFRN